jgi:diguanylate cyclase (GGDEF)-like protein/PAS domain S-box-containing protein
MPTGPSSGGPSTGDQDREFTASDILSSQRWSASAARPKFGLDVSCTKIAVDFQNLDAATAREVIGRNLDLLREAAGTDVVFFATYDQAGETIYTVEVAKGLFTQCSPEVLRGERLERFPWIAERLEHTKILELRDTLRARPEMAGEAQRFGELGMRAVLLVGLGVRGRRYGFLGLATIEPCTTWDVNFHLLLKLVSTSLGCGLERIALEREIAHMTERHELSMPCANDGLWDYDVRRNRTWFSPRWKTMLGYAEDELNSSPDWHKLVHPEDLARVSQLLREHINGRSPIFESVHRLRHRDGEWRWVQSRAKAQLDERGQLQRLIGVELDVTERRLYEEALFREKESAQITLQSIGDGVITTDEHCRVEYLNPVAEELSGWRVEDAMGRPVDEIFRAFHEETCEPLENPLGVAIRRLRSIKAVRPMLFIRRDGNEIYIESTSSPIRDGRGHVTGGVLVFHDVTESRELNRRLSYHASHDVLTGLVNRREFEQRLERALKSAKARETSYALCYLDLDQFKIVNDTCGHSAGDALLGQVGQLLKSKIRWRDTLSRLGGDEFAVLLEACSLDEALRTAEGLRESVRNYKFIWEDRNFRLGASVGVVPITAESEDVASLISAADSACQAAKEQGRNRVHSFEENDLDLMRRRREMQWAARINTALEDGRFDLYRQTIIPLQTDEPGLHYEILLRMRDEQGKTISPDQFIAAAERYGLTPQIDRWVIENTLRWLVSEADEREKLGMCSINLSGQSLGDDKFLPFVIEQFHRSGLDARKICFEITETAAIASFSQANRFIQALKELGCRFALDDFGTGLSSFGYLKHFPVDFLKIDGSFVKEIVNDPIDREMVRSINEIGHLTQKKTIAEFAENEDIITMLRQLGVDYAQGYGVAMPAKIMRGPLDRVISGES